MDVTYYDPSQNRITIAGHTLIGVVSIAVKRNNQLFKNIDGISPVYSARVKMNKKPFTVTVAMLQTSISNTILKDLYNSSEQNINSFFDINVSSDKGIHLATTGYIQDSPDLQLEESLNNHTWTFVANAYSLGGVLDIIN